MAKKANPKRLPCSQADVKKAYEKGKDDTMRALLSIFLWAFCEDFSDRTDDIHRMSRSIMYYSGEIGAGRLKINDIEEALKDEHGWSVELY